MSRTGLCSWASVFKECNSIPFALAQHLEKYIASLVLICLKHRMLASECRLLDDFDLAVGGLKCFGVSSWLLLTNSSWAFDKSYFSAALTFFQVKFVPIAATVLDSKLVLGRMEFPSHLDTLSSLSLLQ